MLSLIHHFQRASIGSQNRDRHRWIDAIALFIKASLSGCLDEAFEQGMGIAGPGLKFWMKLGGNKKRMGGQFNNLDQAPIRRGAADDITCF